MERMVTNPIVAAALGCLIAVWLCHAADCIESKLFDKEDEHFDI